MASKLTASSKRRILASIAIDNIELHDAPHDPKEYCTHVNMTVKIGGKIYPVMYKRGSDGKVDLPPIENSGLTDVYIALMNFAGEHDELNSFASYVSERLTLKANWAGQPWTDEFGVDADGHVCDVEDDDAVMLFEYSNDRNEKYANLILFEVSEKDDDGEWSYVRDYACFHFHLAQERVYRRYMEEQAIREAGQEREAITKKCEFRFMGDDNVCYGRGESKALAADDAMATLGIVPFSQEDNYKNGYFVEVAQRCIQGEWNDVSHAVC